MICIYKPHANHMCYLSGLSLPLMKKNLYLYFKDMKARLVPFGLNALSKVKKLVSGKIKSKSHI